MAGGTGSSSPYRRLQLRAKQRGIPANQKAAVLAALLDGPNPGPRAVRTTKTPTPTLRADEDAGGHAPPEPGMRRRGRGRAVKPPPPPPGWGGPQHPAAVDTPTAPSSAARNVARLAMVRFLYLLLACQLHGTHVVAALALAVAPPLWVIPVV